MVLGRYHAAVKSAPCARPGGPDVPRIALVALVVLAAVGAVVAGVVLVGTRRIVPPEPPAVDARVPSAAPVDAVADGSPAPAPVPAGYDPVAKVRSGLTG